MWQVAEAKNKFSELFTKAMTEGPQKVRRRGDTVVVISEAEYERLAGTRAGKMSLGAYLLQGPSFEGLDLSRDRSPPREVNLEYGDDD